MSDAGETTQAMNPFATTILGYVEDSKTAKRKRMDMNQQNFDCYNLEQDFSHKQEGQSKEFLAKQQVATDQVTSFLQQGVIDNKRWFEVDYEAGVTDNKITKENLQKIVERQINLNKPIELAGDSIKLGHLGALMIMKVHGQPVRKTRWEVNQVEKNAGRKVKLDRVDKYKWALKLELIRQEDYYPDPTGNKLYEVQAIDIDYHKLLELAQMTNKKEGKEVYSIANIEALSPSASTEQEAKKARETNQDQSPQPMRKIIRMFECWGTIIDTATGMVLMSNAQCVVSDGGAVIMPARENPFWHGESPYVTCPLVRVPKSVWHRALADAPTRYNLAQNELFNLMLDGGMMSVFGIKQLRTSYLERPEQVSDGIGAGDTLEVNSSCPPGSKALERVDTGSVPPETFNVFNLVDREGQASSLTNDTRTGVLPQRAVKATEIVASNQSLTGVFNGMVKAMEESYWVPIIKKATLTSAQFMDDLGEADMVAILGKEQAALIGTMEPEEIFAEVANGCRVKVNGFSVIMNKMNDFRKVTSLMQTLGASPELAAEFKKKYSMTRFLGTIIEDLDIDTEKLVLTPAELQQQQQEQQQALAMQMAQITKGQGSAGSSNGMSHVPNVGNLPATGGMPGGEGTAANHAAVSGQ